MRNPRILTGITAGLACVYLATGCFFLPSDEVSHNINIETEAPHEYDLAQVIRGDVISSKTVYCTYSETTEANLCFQTGSLSVRYVYVSEGDNVQKGDLLAKLDTSELDSQYASLSYTIDRLELNLKQTKELMEYDLAALTANYNKGYLSAEAYHDQSEALNNRYQSTIASYEESLYIDRLRLEQITKKLEGASIYSPMDGSIRHVASNLKDSWASAGMTVITVVDASQCAFVIEDSSFESSFRAGDEITLTDTKGNSYDTIGQTFLTEDGTEKTYFLLKDIDLSVKVGTRASYQLVLKDSKDVLMLPFQTVHSVGSEHFVYMQDERGFKVLRYITIGLEGNTYTEITGGLNEGDLVIRK